MKSIFALLAIALAGAAIAEEPAKTDPQKPARPALNLRLDDGTSAAPRITFGQSAATQTKEDREKGLPDLGGKPSQAFDRPVTSSSSSGAVIPNAMDPGTNSSSATYGGR